VAGALERFPQLVAPTLDALRRQFESSPDQVLDDDFRRDAKIVISRWPLRAGVAQSLAAAAPHCGGLSPDQLAQLFEFVASRGLADPHASVWEHMMAAGRALVQQVGEQHVALLQPLLERTMEQPPACESDEVADRLSEGLVVLLGMVARHLPADSPKVMSAVRALLDVLNTPSHAVQQAVADCLSHLAPNIPADQHQGLFDALLARLQLPDASFAERLGGALGLAGLVKGLKIAALKKHNVLAALTGLVEAKQNRGARQGAMMAYEALFRALGSKFEPYVVHILPHLLQCFGDTDAEVRASTGEAAQVVMGALTEHGVRMVLPLLLKAPEDASSNWRAQVESVGMLGSMAHCAPKQLSTCLPQLVPRLLDVMSDPHAKVRQAAKDALQNIGTVIRNPEVLTIVPQLLAGTFMDQQ
jgi:hypothetical protein